MLLFLAANWKWLASAVAAAFLSCILTAMPYRATIANMKAVEAKADAERANQTLEKFEADAARIHDAAQGYADLQANLSSQISVISKDFKDAIKSHPLPLDCRPDDVRVRALTAAVAAANAAAGRVTVPAVPAVK